MEHYLITIYLTSRSLKKISTILSIFIKLESIFVNIIKVYKFVCKKIKFWKNNVNFFILLFKMVIH